MLFLLTIKLNRISRNIILIIIQDISINRTPMKVRPVLVNMNEITKVLINPIKLRQKPRKMKHARILMHNIRHLASPKMNL